MLREGAGKEEARQPVASARAWLLVLLALALMAATTELALLPAGTTMVHT